MNRTSPVAVVVLEVLFVGWLRGALAAGSAAVALAGCTHAAATGKPRVTPSSPAPPPTPVLSAPKSPWIWDKPVRLAVEFGTLRAVSVDSADGAPVPGHLLSGQTVWAASATLAPSSTYTVQATIADERGRVSQRQLSFSTAPAADQLHALITPGDGDVVGVGMPVIVTFNRAVPDRAAVERSLHVITSVPLTGSWHWISSTEVHYRPQNYWPAYTKVTVSTDLDRVYVGENVWGSGNHTSSFSIGSAQVSVADVERHLMTVYRDGKVLAVLPDSTGRTKYPTLNGVHIVIEKMPQIIMDSQTVGIPRNSPDGYYEKVLWDVRISYGGAFVHAAPWSVQSQGTSNVSHGCINLSTANAQWFYGIARRGDVVDVINSPAPPNISDPGMADWNMSWSQWVAGSAL